MNKYKQQELADKYMAATSKLISKSINIINTSYPEMNMIDILMSLPVKMEFREVELSQIQTTDGIPVTADDIDISGYITRDTEAGNPNRLVVFLVFTKDVSQTWDDYFDKAISLSAKKLQNKLAFAYLHEAMHILLKHYDYYFNKVYFDIIEQYKSDMNDRAKQALLGCIQDFWINAYLIEQSNSDSYIRGFGHDQQFGFLYDANLSPKNKTMEALTILLTKEANITQTEIKDSSGEPMAILTEVKLRGIHHRSIDLIAPEIDTTNDAENTESNVMDIDDVMVHTRNSIIEKTKGSGEAGSFSQLGVDYSVPIDWFSYLKSSVFTLAQKYTPKSKQTWGKLKNKMRHIATLPGREYYEKQMAVIISIDQSGSMSNQDLEKVNYVVTELAKKAIFTEVLLHDTKVAANKRFIGKNFGGIRDFVTNRAACGGTSHKEVFEVIKGIRNENKKRKLIYLSFSDNYSDIEHEYDPELFANIEPYWIMTTGGKPVNVPGMQISLEEGLLQR